MNKNILIGVGLAGGLILIGTLFLNQKPSENAPSSEANTTTPTISSKFQNLVPTYPSSTIDSSQESETPTSQDLSLALITQATVTEVNDWYREALSQNGWSIKSDKNVAGYQIIQAEKDNLYTSLQATTGTEAGTVRISQHIKIRQ